LLLRPLGAAAGDAARKLLTRYNSLGALLVATASQRAPAQLVPEQAWSQLQAFSRLISAAWREEAFKARVISTSEALVTYLQLDMCGLERECFRILFLGPDNRLIDDRILWEGTVNRVHAYPREIVRLSIELSATALILIHNHPQGRAAPSETDRLLTRQIANACAAVEIVIHDHVIVARDGIFSFTLDNMITSANQLRHSATSESCR
jgi:DNA repair protein RadC